MVILDSSIFIAGCVDAGCDTHSVFVTGCVDAGCYTHSVLVTGCVDAGCYTHRCSHSAGYRSKVAVLYSEHRSDQLGQVRILSLGEYACIKFN